MVLLETIAQPSATAPALGSEININDDAHSKYGEISAIDVQVEVDDNDNNDHCPIIESPIHPSKNAIQSVLISDKDNDGIDCLTK